MKVITNDTGDSETLSLNHEDGRRVLFFRNPDGLSVYVKDENTTHGVQVVDLFPEEEVELKKFLNGESTPQEEPTGDVTAGHGTGTT